MTERLSEITDRIEGVRQLDGVVGAMTGIASARARIAREQIDAVDRYAATIAAAMGRVGGLRVREADAPPPAAMAGPVVLVVFCAEQGFAGAFSERVLDGIGDDQGRADIFLVGTRGRAVALERGISPVWRAGLPSHSAGIPKFADRLVRAVLDHVARTGPPVLEVVHTVWRSGAAHVERRVLFPADPAPAPDTAGPAPLTNLPVQALLEELGADYLHAQLCNAALHAFAAENEARMMVMNSAQARIGRELETLEAAQHRVRQEAITAEIIEIAAGERASRQDEKAGGGGSRSR